MTGYSKEEEERFNKFVDDGHLNLIIPKKKKIKKKNRPRGLRKGQWKKS